MFPERSPENNVCRVAPFLFSQYIARMLWRNSRGRPLNVLPLSLIRAGIYNRSTYAAEKRAALDAWANHIKIILAANVTAAKTMTATVPISTA
jgi:hypothetical protein